MLTLAKTLKPETQIAYLNKVKKTNVSFLKLCRKSKKENFIYNGEYKRIKKFYKGMMNRVFYINEDVYSDISLTQVPLLTRYETKVWQSLSSTICTTFKKWNKENIKPGKRPVQDTDEYKEKRLQRALLTDIGTCGYCEREQEIENGGIYDHGFTVGQGFRNGVCPGAQLTPYERSPEAKELLVTHLKEDLVTIQKQKPDQKVVDFFNSLQFQWTKEKIDNYNKNCQTYERKYDRDIGTFKTREFLEKPLYRLVTLEKLNEIFNNALSFIQSRLERQEAKLKIWKAVPTYREEALARKQKQQKKENK
jgi:hypothetical protein